MYVYLDNIVIGHDYDRVANRFQECLELQFCFLIIRFFQHDDKFCTVAEPDLRLGLCTDADCAFLLRSLKGIVHLFPKKCIIGSLQHLHKPLSAGIHHAGFLQHRKHVRRLLKNCIRLFDDQTAELIHILQRLCQLRRLQSRSFGHGQDGSLLGLHNRFVGCFHRLLHGIGQIDHIQLLMVLDPFGKSPQELGQNHAGISSGAAQGSGGDTFGKRLHIQLCQTADLSGRGRDRQCHVRPRISVRHRKHIQFIYPLFSGFQIFGTAQKHLCNHPGINRLYHNADPPSLINHSHAFYKDVDPADLHTRKCFHLIFN